MVHAKYCNHLFPRLKSSSGNYWHTEEGKIRVYFILTQQKENYSLIFIQNSLFFFVFQVLQKYESDS